MNKMKQAGGIQQKAINFGWIVLFEKDGGKKIRGVLISKNEKRK